MIQQKRFSSLPIKLKPNPAEITKAMPITNFVEAHMLRHAGTLYKLSRTEGDQTT